MDEFKQVSEKQCGMEPWTVISVNPVEISCIVD